MRTTVAALALLWLAAPLRAEAAPATPEPPPKPGGPRNPRIELVTMGAGPELLHRWGHAALCVRYPDDPAHDECYNYGAAFPTSLTSLGWSFLRGTAKFMVIVQPYRNMLEMYRGQDRSLWIQRMPYTRGQVDQMIGLLENDLREENRYYTYHHMWDNCATRLRDHLDKVAGGALRRGGDKGIGLTFRDLARRGLSGRPLLLVGTTLGFGRRLEQEITEWASMGHPDYLRAVVAAKLGAKPVQVYARRAKPLPKHPGYGHGYLAGLALLLALGLVVTRRVGKYERPALATATVVLSLLGAALWLTALVTAVPELYLNEALLVFWPTDALLLRLGERRRQLYLRIRILGLIIVSALLLSGVLIQPLLSAVLIPLLVCLALFRFPLWPAAELAPEPEPDAEKAAKAPRGASAPKHRKDRKQPKARRAGRR